ncbi:zf-CCHC domain containing protein [Trichuris trichiura]|uniref:Zf-CCHC domain containing protein n=1 Tax=Trichuris trichiura TaxID=36087 RepID=A0A077ZM05_TRITR|nr:zf-CCHC domain containing protein [Trichuris trichiura]
MSESEPRIAYCINSVTLPRPFENGNFTEWLLKFELCANANGWDDAVKRLKLPTLLEGEAFLVYRSVGPDNSKSYRELVEALKSALRPIGTRRIAYSEFEKMTLRPGESVLAFAHRLSQAAEVALPGLDQNAMDQLLVQRLLSAMPEAYRNHMLLESDTWMLQEAIGKLRSLMSFDSAGEMVPVTAVGAITASTSRLDMLERKIDDLTKQLASMLQQRLPSNKRAGCFVCGSVEHFARSCPRAERRGRSARYRSRQLN